MLLYLLLYLLGGATFLWILIATSKPDPETERRERGAISSSTNNS
jgi:hypothetical protein